MSRRASGGRRVCAALGAVLACLALAGCSTGSEAAGTTAGATAATTTAGMAVGTLRVDLSKNYGDRYANGLLPVGDGKYLTTAAKKGYVYACQGYARNLQVDPGGAQARGPWFVDHDTKYDVNKKLHVQGHVLWRADLSIKDKQGVRTIVTNDLPTHPTGTFPIQGSDPAYAYDRNPNTITGQRFTFALTDHPQYGSPSCIGGTVGVMLTGVLLFSAFDAGGRDAGAWEVQDSCDGHPQQRGVYHYHTLSTCITDVGVKDVIGWALDGFPITGPKVGKHNVLTTADLDACHGITGPVHLDGKNVLTYHYVMTEDFPYSISCFRGTPIRMQQH
jgi:hypothetical protein